MALLIAIGSLTAGVIIGVIATYRFSSTSPVKVRQLEQQIEDLQQTHKAYRENVSTHFNTTAELIQQMTESYKDVYQHLASGAQTLCDHEVADKMLPAGERDRLFREESEESEESEDTAVADETGDTTTGAHETASEPEPPRDYADRGASGGGALSEDYGLGKSETGSEKADVTEPTGEKSAGSMDSGKIATPAGDDSATEGSTAGGEQPREADRDAADPDAPYRKPETAGHDDQRETSDDALNAGTESPDTESPDKDSRYKG